MKQVSQEELAMNEQAKDVAASVLGEPVVAATRCEQITQDMTLEAAGSGKVMRGMAKFSRGIAKPGAMAMGLNKMSKDLHGGGLPKSFVLAVTDTQVAALEDNQKGGQLVAGKVVKTWGRDEISARGGEAIMVPGEDRQQITLYIPLDEAKSKYIKAANVQMAKAGGTARPVRFLVAKDAASQAVIDELSKNAPMPGANVMIGGQSVADMMAAAGGGAPAAADPTEQLTKLADLHERGVLSDEEFAAQKAKILGS
jgi:Short C-terminal domain